MPGKMARSAPRLPFGLLELPVAVRTSRLASRQSRKLLSFTPVAGHLGNPGLCRRQVIDLCRLRHMSPGWTTGASSARESPLCAQSTKSTVARPWTKSSPTFRPADG